MANQCKPLEPCGQSDCDALLEVQGLLPKGILWRVDDDRVLSKFWRTIAKAKALVMQAICQEWREANPCTAQRTLPRWAKQYCFPDCVDLTQENMCRWIELIQSCPMGTEGFLSGLLEFIELDDRLEVKFPDCCESLFGCDEAVCIRVCGPFEAFTVEDCCPDWGIFKTIQNPCGWVHVPAIECLREYFPAGWKIKYQPDCDPNLIRQIRSRH